MKTVFFNRLLISTSITLAACLVVIITFLIIEPSAVCAQSSCTGAMPPINTTDTGSQAPTYPKGALVEVFTTGLSDEQRRQVDIALNNMNSSNGANGSGVRFVGHGSGLPGSGQYSLTIQNGNLGPVTAARISQNAPNGQTSSATMTFNTEGATHDGQTGSSPYYDDSLLGYDTVFIKKTLHELGHAMGLDDNNHPQTPGHSIMNNGVGPNCQNDRCNNQATSVQPCDNSAIQYHPNYDESGISGGGDVGGGDVGGDCRFDPARCDTGRDDCIPQTCPEECERWDPYTGNCYIGDCEPVSCP